MKQNLKVPQKANTISAKLPAKSSKPAKAARAPNPVNSKPPHRDRPRRSQSFSFGERRPSVHWISPSIFAPTVPPVVDSDRVINLSQVFEYPSQPATLPPKPSSKAARKPRKRNDLPKQKPDCVHESKRPKKDTDSTESSCKSPGYVRLERPRGQQKRLSYILSNDPYNVLGVSPSATKSVMKNAFRHKAIGTHPDKGGSEEEFIRLHMAYDILIDDVYFVLITLPSK